MVLVPTLRPDVSLIHVQRADPLGNVVIEGFATHEPEMVRASTHTVVSCEELIPTETIRDHPERTTIPFLYVSAVVVQPFGAYPTSTYRYYDYDPEHVTLPAGGAGRGGPRPGVPGGLRVGVPELRGVPGARRRPGPSGAAAPGHGGIPLSYTRRELMVIEAARHVRDGDVVFVGTGLPLLATALAQRLHAPHVVCVIESGVIAPRVRPTPVSVSDPRVMHRAVRLGTLREVLGGLLQRGLVDLGFLGGAQVDRFGNINSTWVREGERTKRLPGSGGGNDMASHCRRFLVITRHERRRFPERCDYVTSPGFLDGPGGRERAGLAGEFGIIVVTDLAVLENDPDTCVLRITRLMPGVSEDQVQGETGFALTVAPHVRPVDPPGAKELRVLREEMDPGRVFLRDDEPSAGPKGDR